jgi:4,5-DOPA dioxygenase extradiol
MTHSALSHPASQPTLFVSHGAPTFALQPGVAGAQLMALGQALRKPEAVLVVSPHWRSQSLRVAGTAHPRTIHDFGGFPQQLYSLQYPAPGAPQWAQRTTRLLQSVGYKAELDMHQGLDHGAWVPLSYLFPKADVPVFQVSMPFDLNAQSALELGKGLRKLADEGVLIIGSGSLTHNLYEFQMDDQSHSHPIDLQFAPDYIGQFVAWVRQEVIMGNHANLVRTMALAPHAKRAHPSLDHFLPLLVAAGAAEPLAPVTVLDGGVTHKVLAMETYIYGDFFLKIAM